MSSGRLQTRGLIQPGGGSDQLLTDDERTLEEVEFELASGALELFGLSQRSGRRCAGRFNPRKPVVRLDQLILAAGVFEAVRMALAHARHARTLLDTWGFGEVLPYGRTIAILLSGPPGVGKTACAEAIADELNSPILAVDYSEIQNCYVGQTEKNIVRVFREARANDAVLFWDEADSMFFGRDRAEHDWEVRNVNMLLQELERFDGVCILATNRKIALDSALSRRIAIKIELDRPDRELRRHIWEKLMPPRMPLADDVDVERLSEADFVGGEIKNVIVNAARRALLRGEDTRVTMSDFEQATRQERANRWGEVGSRRLGFGRV
jgi:SpoVK/Ycf46/Vps4 family AAA+-type ATPase